MKKPLRIALFAIPLLMFAGMVLLFASGIGKDPSYLPSARIGKAFPAFSLASLADPEKMLSEKDLKGQVALLNVWATWCPSCRIEHPAFMQLKAAGIPIYGMNYKDEREAAKKYLSTLGDPFLFSIYDDTGNLGIDLGVYGAPETYILDREGQVRYRFVGVLDEENWEQTLKPCYQALLNEQAAAAEKACRS